MGLVEAAVRLGGVETGIAAFATLFALLSMLAPDAELPTAPTLRSAAPASLAVLWDTPLVGCAALEAVVAEAAAAPEGTQTAPCVYELSVRPAGQEGGWRVAAGTPREYSPGAYLSFTVDGLEPDSGYHVRVRHARGPGAGLNAPEWGGYSAESAELRTLPRSGAKPAKRGGSGGGGGSRLPLRQNVTARLNRIGSTLSWAWRTGLHVAVLGALLVFAVLLAQVDLAARGSTLLDKIFALRKREAVVAAVAGSGLFAVARGTLAHADAVDVLGAVSWQSAHNAAMACAGLVALVLANHLWWHLRKLRWAPLSNGASYLVTLTFFSGAALRGLARFLPGLSPAGAFGAWVMMMVVVTQVASQVIQLLGLSGGKICSPAEETSREVVALGTATQRRASVAGAVAAIGPE